MALEDFLPEELEALQPLGALEDDPLDVDAGADSVSEDSDFLDLRTLDEIEELRADTPAEQAEVASPAATTRDTGTAAPAATRVKTQAPPVARRQATEEEAAIDLDEDLFDFGSPSDENLDSLMALGNDLAEVLSEVGAAPGTRELEQTAGYATLELDELEDPEDPDGIGDDDVDFDDEPDTRRARAKDEPGRKRRRSASSADDAAPVTVLDPRQLRSRPSWLAIASVLGANFVLLFFAWSASRSLHAHITEVRQELRQQPGIVPAAGQPAQRPESEARTDAAAAGSLRPSVAETAPASSIALPILPDTQNMALEIAEQEIAEERFAPARRRLYRLLATADALDQKTRGGVEARALFLIGDTYARQASLAEGRP